VFRYRSAGHILCRHRTTAATLRALPPKEESLVMRHPFEVELAARVTRERALAEAAAARRVRVALVTRSPRGAHPAAWLCRAVGRGLIAAGERLAGSAGARPVRTEPSTGAFA
jgi:hypothetical protein